MTILFTMRQQQQRRALTVLGLLAVVLVSVTLQACVSSASATELYDDRSVQVGERHHPSDRSGHYLDHDCMRSIDCRHDGCVEPSFCDGPVIVSTKAETRLPDNTGVESAVAATIDELVLAVNSPTTPLVRPVYRVTAAAVSLIVQYCVYLI